MNLSVWLIIILLILGTALYVAAEFAAVAVRRGQIRQLADQGNVLARGLAPMLDDAQRLDRYIAACQIGITLTSLVLGAFGQATLAVDLVPLFEDWGGLRHVAAQSASAAIVLLLLTGLQVVLGELVPKSLALQFPVQVALYTYLPMRWSLAVYSWFIVILNGSGWLLLRLVGAPQTGERHVHSPEEIDLLIGESRKGGHLKAIEQRRLQQALHLNLRTARQLMAPRRLVTAIDIDTPAEQVLQQAIESPYMRIPVYRDSAENIVGVLHIKDLAAQYAQEGAAGALRDSLRPVIGVPEGLTADRLLTVLRERRAHQALVLDEFGNIEGIVTLEDVLAELVGDIGDEFKREQNHPQRLPDGRVRLPGTLRLDRASPWTGADWAGESDTVAGHVLAALDRIPESGERINVEGVEVEIEHMDGRAITSLVVRPRPPRGQEQG